MKFVNCKKTLSKCLKISKMLVKGIVRLSKKLLQKIYLIIINSKNDRIINIKEKKKDKYKKCQSIRKNKTPKKNI